jgi:hypothetical protein
MPMSRTRPGGSWSKRQPLAPAEKSDKRDETIMEMMKMKAFRKGDRGNRSKHQPLAHVEISSQKSTAKSLALSI